ncbi:Response regulator protein VraR [Microbacterium sp. 8M]|uniref:LuxR C-terminal-related transcriptional regulator n=1 Tax=Microbacterium sp. 8M TaxID=2653153 RepID=UPI0012F372A9|nr:LuxR C-terminal-related transcriptional regulator [Microbacterium sp. 8M]VXB06371.1 Response regulator protein VraR [Microbacterium sp. 8M]
MDGMKQARPAARHDMRPPAGGGGDAAAAQRAFASHAVPAERISVAPHVRTLVLTACGGDPAVADALLAALGPEHRRGWRALPVPLPQLPAHTAHLARVLPVGADPDVMLALALCGRGPATVLREITQDAEDHVLASPSGRLLEVHGGAFRLGDPALRTSLLAVSTAADRARAHGILATAFAEAGAADTALWHRACASATGDPAFVEPLLAQSRAALQSGAASRAWARAVEAVEHAPSGTPAHATALLWAARAALAGGWVTDALECAQRSSRIGAASRATAAEVLVLAHTLRHGAAWLAAGGRLPLGAEERAALQVWSAARAGERRSGDAAVADDGIERVAHALGLGLGGDPDAGLRALAEPDPRHAAGAIAGLPARAPLLRARRAVAEVLLHVWAGRMGVALELLRSGAAELPVALPFAGLAVTLSRRLELAVEGRVGQSSRDLDAAVPWPCEPGGFVDRAIHAYLQGRSDEAAVHLGLWHDRDRPAEAFGVPALDEVGPLGGPGAPEPPEGTAARALRERVRAAREGSWRTDLDAVAEESRGIRSPFERARVEALLGSSCAARGDPGRGVRHLRAARSLFEESGALAWRDMVDRRLRTLAAQDPRGNASDADGGVSSPLSVCRAVWQPILTTRELEVALLMAEGRSNREIARALHVSVRTVEVHGGRIFAKLDVRTRHELTVLAHRTDQHL